MATWMVTGSFVLLVITLLVVIACLVILIIKLFNTTVCTGGTGVSSSSISSLSELTTKSYSSQTRVSSAGAVSVFGDGRDRDGEFVGLGKMTLSKDAFYNNLKLDNSTLNTNGYRLFVAGTLQMLNNSIIQNSGKDGAANSGPLVQGGKGASAGTLGGGGDGGNGYLKDGSKSDLHGVGSKNVIWGSNTTLFSGADGTLSAAVAEYGVGQAGKVTTNTVRTKFDAAHALNPDHQPSASMPLLSGGSGGGGGQGAAQYPGSGGGGGGGVVLVAAKTLIVGKGGGTVVAAGGNGGPLSSGGPFNSTSGGGGGGGLVLIATESRPSSYDGLIINVDGGLSLDSLGRSVQASPGRVVHWFDSNEVDANPTQFITARTTLVQHTPIAPLSTFGQGVVFQEVDTSSAGIVRSTDGTQFSVDMSGLYMIAADIALDTFQSSSVKGQIVKNGDPEYQSFGAKNIQNIGQSQTIAIWSIVPLEAKDSFEIRIASDGSHESITIKPQSTLAAILLAPT